jgi:hypothetical protein
LIVTSIAVWAWTNEALNKHASAITRRPTVTRALAMQHAISPSPCSDM